MAEIMARHSQHANDPARETRPAFRIFPQDGSCFCERGHPRPGGMLYVQKK